MRRRLRGPRGQIHKLPPLLWLTLVWVMLWGTWTWANLITGVAVAVAITLVLPLPPVMLGGRVRPAGLVRLIARFALDLVLSSVQVAWKAVRLGPEPCNAVVAVRMRSRSDLLLTVTSGILTLIPGSIVIEVSRSQRALYAHVFDVSDLSEIEEYRRSVRALEARVIRAIGSRAALRELDAEDSASSTPGSRP